MQAYHFNLTSIDEKPITRKTEVLKLKVKAYKLPQAKSNITFWYNLKDIPNPENAENPGIYMLVKNSEEISPNVYEMEDYDGRKFNLELLYEE